MSNIDRSWMYERRLNASGTVSQDFIKGLDEFLEFAKSKPEFMRDGLIRCPCATVPRKNSNRPRVGCNNLKFIREESVITHLLRFGFRAHYQVWESHGEKRLADHRRRNVVEPMNVDVSDQPNSSEFEREGTTMHDDDHVRMVDMVMDAARPNNVWDQLPTEAQNPTKVVQDWLNILSAAREPVSHCSKLTILEATAECMNIKTEGNVSERTYNQFMDVIQKLLPENNKMTRSWDDTCKIVKNLGLGFQLIDACPNDCQLYYKSTLNDTQCRICKHDRYKPGKNGGGETTNMGDREKNKKKLVGWKQLRYLPLIPRLQRLYTFKDTASDMKWHKTCPRKEGMLSHPSDGEAWKHFDETYSDFAADPRNVRLCLSTDGFNPFGGSTRAYSCWPVIVTPLNLPPWVCMKEPYMFLTLLVPGPKGPGKNLDIYLQPLIDELQYLWHNGVETWDASTNKNFQMKAALMWTISDFPAYGYLSGWSTHSELSCPYCMENTKAFRLKKGKKPCFFDCHRQFLPTNHPFRTLSQQFRKGRVEKDKPPPRLSGDEMLRKVAHWGQISGVQQMGSLIIRVLGNVTIGRSVVYSGTYLIGRQTWFVTTLT